MAVIFNPLRTLASLFASDVNERAGRTPLAPMPQAVVGHCDY
jgi:hypothetical protein